MNEGEVFFTVAEFAFLVGRTQENIVNRLRSGRLKGQQAVRGGAWRVPESELAKYWGNLYGRPSYSKADRE